MNTRVLRLRHSLRLVHGGTSSVVPRVDARLLPPVWGHWRLAVKSDRILLSADERFLLEEPEETPLEVRILDPRKALFFEDGGRWEVTLARDEEPPHPFTLLPIPTRVEVELVRRTGVARTGRDVRITSNGDEVQLPEAEPGRYRSPLLRWGPEFRTFTVLSNNQTVGPGALNPSRTLTRIRFVVP